MNATAQHNEDGTDFCERCDHLILEACGPNDSLILGALAKAFLLGGRIFVQPIGNEAVCYDIADQTELFMNQVLEES